MDFTVNCVCGCPGGALMAVTGGDLAAWRRVAANGQVTAITCSDCGCKHDLEDTGSNVGVVDKSQPSIGSINVATGPVAGGTSVVVTGHRLDFGTFTIKFDGVAGVNPRSFTLTSVTVDTPALPYVCVKLQNSVGSLALNDVLTGSISGQTGTYLGFDGRGARLGSLSGAPTPGEWLLKDASNKLQVAGANIYAACDVTVENENGKRTDVF